jgi:hypothetical protein
MALQCAPSASKRPNAPVSQKLDSKLFRIISCLPGRNHNQQQQQQQQTISLPLVRPQHNYRTDSKVALSNSIKEGGKRRTRTT